MPAVAVAHFIGAHIGVVDGEIRALGEAEAEQPPRRVERGADHVVEHEIRLHLRLVEVVLGSSYLLGVIAPVPRLDRLVHALAACQRLYVRALGRSLVFGRLPYLPQETFDRRDLLRHRIVEPVGGVSVVAEKPRLLGAQRQYLADERPVVVRPLLRPAPRPRFVDELAQIATRREGQERLDRGARQGDRRNARQGRAPSPPAAAAARAKSGSPSRSSSSSTSCHSSSSCSTFWPKRVCRLARRSEIAAMRGFCSGASSAPLRTNRDGAARAGAVGPPPRPMRAARIEIGHAPEQVGVERDAHLVLRELGRVVAGDAHRGRRWSCWN